MGKVSIDFRRKRVARVAALLRENAALTQTQDWRLDHGHLIGDVPLRRNNGEPILSDRDKQMVREVDIAAVPDERSHLVRGLAPYDRSRHDLRYMATAQPKTILQFIEDYEALLADAETRIAALEDQADNLGAELRERS